MRISSAAIFTLAALAASNVDNQATAATDSTSSNEQKVKSVVIPVVENTPAPTQAIAQPETLAVGQFSSVNSEQLTVNSEQLSVNNKQLSVNNNQVKPKKQEKEQQKQQKQIVIKNSPAPPISPSPNLPISPSPNPPLPPQIAPVKTNSDFVVPASSVRIVGVTPELQEVIKGVIKTQQGGDTSETQLKQDVAAILETGLFAGATVNSRSDEQGLSVVYQVKPLVVRSLQLSNAKALSYQVAQKVFADANWQAY